MTMPLLITLLSTLIAPEERRNNIAFSTPQHLQAIGRLGALGHVGLDSMTLTKSSQIFVKGRDRGIAIVAMENESLLYIAPVR